MNHSSISVQRLSLIALLLCATSCVHSRPAEHASSSPSVILWAWETPEDYRSLDPHRYGVAYLDQTIFVTDRIEVVPRRQPLAMAPGMKLIAVTRIEAHPGSGKLDDPVTAKKIAELIVSSVGRRNASAVQVDFDARQSQRRFYATLLKELRQTRCRCPLRR